MSTCGGQGHRKSRGAMGKGFHVQNFPTNYLFIVGVVNQSMKKKQREDAAQKAKNKINLIASWGPFLRKKSLEALGKYPLFPPPPLLPLGGPLWRPWGSIPSFPLPPLGGPAEETTHNAVMKMDSLVPRPEEEEEENLKGMGFNRLRMHLIAHTIDILPYARDANYRS